jgi:hypothetical protein
MAKNITVPVVIYAEVVTHVACSLEAEGFPEYPLLLIG